MRASEGTAARAAGCCDVVAVALQRTVIWEDYVSLEARGVYII